MKKTILIIVFIALILVIFFLPIYYFENLRRFNIQKSNIDSVQISQDIVNVLNEKYSTANKEFIICLFGIIEENTLIISDYDYPKYFEATAGDIKFVSCNDFFNPIKKQKYLGTIHNHPQGICRLGEQDIFTFGKSDDAIIGVICGNNNINFFTQNNLLEAIDLETL